MKITRAVLPVAVGIAFTFSMCDYIVIPNEVTTSVPSTFDTTKRVALLEEWTGHTCINCPDAAADIVEWKTVYGQSLIAISIHDGYFSDPCPPGMPMCGVGHPGAFADDFRSATGADYSANFPDALLFQPQGMVNRLGYASNTHLKTSTAWIPVIDSIVQEDACASIHIDHEYNASTRQLGVTVRGTWLQAYPGNINVCIMLTESGMIGWQTDVTECYPEFVFRDVLRECLNTPGSITGTVLSTGTTSVGTGYSYALPTAYTLPAAFDATHCHLVAFLYDVDTQEVLQAWEEEL